MHVAACAALLARVQSALRGVSLTDTDLTGAFSLGRDLLFSPWNIMQVRMKYTQPSSGTSQGCFSSWTATGSLRFVFFAMFFSFSP